ncbi:guanylate kinase [Hypoxylon argillaceum]|nr:guanylate kinase [Hypoxylon argillaceum]KAI1144951.1 guanylate kinase [Nemania diffusa]
MADNVVLSTPLSGRRPIVISGPSGVGKSTLFRRLMETHPDVFATTVSHTTRKPRPGEIEGVTYYYVSRDRFQSLIEETAFIEYTEFNGNFYGTSKQTIVDQIAKGLIILLDIEMEGVKQLKKEQLKAGSQINPRFVFIKPPSYEALETRLRSRGTEDERSIQDRLGRARAELDFAETGVHDKVIINQDLDDAFQELEEFVFG